MSNQIEELAQRQRLYVKQKAKEAHDKLIDMGLPNDGPTNAAAREVLLNIVFDAFMGHGL